jgi:DNA invertase Pin-like site-specific DNA recombinase
MKFVAYYRKSTESEDRQLLSLDAQEREALFLADKNTLTIAKTFKESMSAKSPGRPLFNEMMKLIQSGKIDAIVCWKLDRLARNFIDGGLIIDLLQRGVIKEIQTSEGVHRPGDDVMLLAIKFGMANQYSRSLSVDVKRGNREKFARGGWPGRAKFGYENDKGDKTVYPDGDAPYVIRAFELYATGSYSFKDIAGILYEEGLRTGTGKKVPGGNIHRFISDPFYYGMMRKYGRLQAGNHTPLISKDLFDQAQRVLENKNRPRPQNHFFPLRGFMYCEDCGCMLTASLKKGHQYYYCTNGKGICSEHKTYLREKTLYPIVASLFEKITIDEEMVEMLYLSAKEDTELENGYSDSILSTLKTRLNAVTAKESRLLDTFLDEQISKDVYDAKILEIQNEKTILIKQISDTQEKSQHTISTLEPTKKVFLQASRATKEFLDGDDVKKREVIETILWNFSMKGGNMAQHEFKSPYSILSKVPQNADFQLLREMLNDVRTYFMGVESWEMFPNFANMDNITTCR